MSDLYSRVKQGVEEYSGIYQNISGESRVYAENIFEGVVNLVSDACSFTDNNSDRSTESKLGDIDYNLKSIASGSLGLAAEGYLVCFMTAIAPAYLTSLALGIEDKAVEEIDRFFKIARLPYDILDYLQEEIKP